MGEEEMCGSALPERYNELIKQHQKRMYVDDDDEEVLDFTNPRNDKDGFLFPDQDEEVNGGDYVPESTSTRGLPTIRISGLFGFGAPVAAKVKTTEYDDDDDDEVYAVHNTSAFGIDPAESRKFAFLVLSFLVFCICVISIAVPIYIKEKESLGDTTFGSHSDADTPGVDASPNRTQDFSLNPTIEPTMAPTNGQGKAVRAPSFDRIDNDSPVSVGSPTPATQGEQQGTLNPPPTPTESKPADDKVWRRRGDYIRGKNSGDKLGESIALNADGDIVAIGVPGYGFNSGMVQVYHYMNRTWSPMGRELNGIGRFGVSMDLSTDGNTIAIGGNLASNSNDNKVKGHVRVFRFDADTLGDWMPLGKTLEGDEENENLGWSVSLSGDGERLAVGSPSYGSNSMGRVQLFFYHAQEWHLSPVQIPLDSSKKGTGHAVSFSENGDRLAVVSTGSDTVDPHITVWRRFNNTLWTQFGASITNVGNQVDHFEHRVQLSGDGNTLLVTARFNDKNGFTQAYYAKDGYWVQQGQTIPVEEEQGTTPGKKPDTSMDHMSCSVNTDGSHIAIGSPRAFNNQGIVRVYQMQNGWWEQVGKDIRGPDGFGQAVALNADANHIAIGGGTNDADKGIASVYQRHTESE